MLRYCIPTLNRFEELRKAIISVNSGTLVPDEIVVIDNSGNGGSTKALHDILQKYTNVYILPQSINLGVATSWNLFHTLYPDGYKIIANDDVFVHQNTVYELINMADTFPDEIFFHGANTSGNAFSLFLLTARGFHEIGAFDEKFHPAYYEDNDYAHRMLVKKRRMINVAKATYDHVGSATIRAFTQQQMDDHHKAFQRNTQYYLRKWGGMPGKEVYKHPFNGSLA